MARLEVIMDHHLVMGTVTLVQDGIPQVHVTVAALTLAVITEVTSMVAVEGALAPGVEVVEGALVQGMKVVVTA